MLLTRAVLDQVVSGAVTVVFRRWQRPTVKAGGRLRSAVGELAIAAVDVIDPAQISDDDARRAGYPDASAVRQDLFRERPVSARGARPTGESLVYRVQVAYVGGDARAALRADDALDELTVRDLRARLDRLDERSTHGVWTLQMLRTIAAQPGRRAPDLAAEAGRDTLPFKADVRKLKELGLTESLTVGYQLSPRGARLLALTEANQTSSLRKKQLREK